MSPLPYPKRGGDLNGLRDYVSASDRSFTLLLAFLVQCFNPHKPYPVAGIFGEQGAGKSTVSRVIRALVDPSSVATRSQPQSERDLIIAASNGRIMAFDNASTLSPSLSDALCRLSTGAGFGTRQLYADREEEVFQAARPILINGINDIITRSDLADRSLFIHLKAIPENRRRTEASLWSDFEKDRPRLLGALLDAAHTALTRLDEVELDTLPRMADFAKWVVAAEPALPIEEGSFMDGYTSNQADAATTLLDEKPVARAIQKLLNKRDNGIWEGIMSELIDALKPHLPTASAMMRDYPDTVQAMGAELRRVMPLLRKVGIQREDDILSDSRKRAFRLVMKG